MGRLLKLKLHFDGTPEQKSLNSIARTCASSNRWCSWGDVNQSSKIRGRNIWWFSCSGHGGYIVIKTDGDGIIIPEGYVHEMGFSNGVKVYAFEEDCAWAVLEYYNPDIALLSYTKRKKDNPNYLKTFEEHMESVVETVISWSQIYVKPEHKEQAKAHLIKRIAELDEWYKMADEDHKEYALNNMEYEVTKLEKVCG